MDKSSFVKSVDAPKSLAESAWEKSGGNEEKARDLLSPDELKVKARFSDPDDGFFGLLSFTWGVDSSSASNRNQIVVGDSDAGDVSSSMSYDAFNRKIEDFVTEGSSMGGYTDQLGQALDSSLSDSSSDLAQALDNRDFRGLDKIFQKLISDELELGGASVSSDVEVERQIEAKSSAGAKQTSSSKSSSSKDDVKYLQCSVQINPVKGVPVTKITPGDRVYVDITDSSGGNSRIIQELESRADENGLIPARLSSKRRTDAGNLRLEVDFTDDIKGTVSCGKDVSILVPEDTKSSMSDAGGGLPDILTDEIFIGTTVAIIVILIVGLWLFL